MQVWCEGELVGHLNISVTDYQRQIVLRKMSGFSMMQAPAPTAFADIEEITLQLGRRELAFDMNRLENSHLSAMEMLIAKGVDPRDPSLQMDLDPVRYRRVYSWRVVEATKTEVEAIFDMDIYEPA